MKRPPLILLATLAAPVVLFFAGALIWAVVYTAGISSEEPEVHAPLAKMRVTRVYGRTNEVVVTLDPATRLETVAPVSLFGGFEPEMTARDAASKFGPPNGSWSDPIFRVKAPYYETADARISLCEVRESGGINWVTVAYPRGGCRQEDLLAAPLREQLRTPLSGARGSVQVRVLRSVGWGGVTLWLDRGACRGVTFTAREGPQD